MQFPAVVFLHYAKVDLFAKEVCKRTIPEIFQSYSNEA